MNGTGYGFFAMLLIGAIAGWIAEKVTKSDHGLLTNILAGVAGSFVGTRLLEALGVMPHGGFFWTVLVAAGGAAALIVAWRAIAGGSRG
ncbi:MAG: GlsB/YeaQ/YmgE family stress response membrane protein [Methylobacteriaceae bacterium]|nr:GlsB/YeaQ/YmgE family stress response membrane protein [Methylobacteriaceae bacterium]